MSSGCLAGADFAPKRRALVLQHAAIDLVRDASLERSKGFGLRVAGGHSFCDVVLSWSRSLQLGHGDSMHGYVELAIASPIETVPLLVTR